MTGVRRFSFLRLRQMIKKELKQLVRDPKAKPLIFVSPIVQFLLLSYATTTDVERIATVVVDQDRTTDSRALVEAYQATGYFQIVARPDRAEAIAPALDRGEAMVGIVIPPNFSHDYRSGREARVQALIDGSDASVATVAQSYVGQVAARFGATADGRVRAGPGVEVRARAWFNPSLKSRLFNVPSIMGILLLMTCLMLTSMAVVREREIGTLDQLLVSPIEPMELMLGKLLPILGVGIIHLSIFVSLSLLHFGVPFRGSALALALAALLFLLAALAVGLLISAVSRTQQEAFMLMVLTVLPAVVLSGFLSPIESIPSWLRWVTYANPIRHFLEIVRGVFLKGTGLRELWFQYATLAATASLALGLATHRFRRSIA